MAQLGTTAVAIVRALTASIVIVTAGAVAAVLLGWIMLETFGSVIMFFVYFFLMATLLFFGAAAIAGHCAARLDRAHPILAAAITALPIGLATGFIFNLDMSTTVVSTLVSVGTAALVAAHAPLVALPAGTNQAGGTASSPGASRGL